jgi:hypothetical protein
MAKTSNKKKVLHKDILLYLNSTPNEKHSKEYLADKFDVSENTIKKHLNRAFTEDPKKIISQLMDFIPNAEAFLSLCKKEFGQDVKENNFMDFNDVCKKWLDHVKAEVHGNFLNESLKNYVTKNVATIPMNELDLFLTEDYSEFMTSVGNSLVSLTGKISEEIIAMGLSNAGLKSGKDFSKEGKGFNADLIILNKKNKSNQSDLYLEIKSFYARERFSVALSSIKAHLKVGVGFFIEPKEFNLSSTQKYLDIPTAAIYMPDKTYVKVDGNSKARVTSNGSSLYRPLSQFCSDMKEFNSKGKLPDYKFIAS